MTNWHALLHERFSQQSTPVVLFSDSVRSAASLWAGMRAWTRAFRTVGVGAGDRVVSVLPGGEALLQLALACLWESVGLVLVDTDRERPQVAVDPHALLGRYDARCLVGAMVDGAPVIEPAAGGWPLTPAAGWRVRATAAFDGPLACGFTDTASTVVLPYATCLAAAPRSRTRGLLAGARVLTLCHWQQRGGLWGGVILPLLHAEELFVPTDRTDAAEVHRLLDEQPVTHALVDTGTPAEVRALLIEQGVPMIAVPVEHG